MLCETDVNEGGKVPPTLFDSGNSHIKQTDNQIGQTLSECGSLLDGSMLDESGDNNDDFLKTLKDNRNLNPKNLVVGSLNINSIRNKFSAMKYLLSNGYIDILALCETKLDESFPLAQFQVENYKYHRSDRTAYGGGLALYFRSDLPQRRRYDLEKISVADSVCEVIIAECIPYKKEKWIFVLMYKPPNVIDSVFNLFLSRVCENVLAETDNVVFLGDTNCDMLVGNNVLIICVFRMI